MKYLLLIIFLTINFCFADIPDRHKNKDYTYTPIASGKYLRLGKIDGWEMVERTKGTGNAVSIAALTENDELILIEQFRIPVQSRILSLPAGLIGDKGVESVEETAQRELKEETGYTTTLENFSLVSTSPKSAGLTSELGHLVIATAKVSKEKQDLEKAEIKAKLQVFTVKISELTDFINKKREAGVLINSEIFSALYFLIR